MAKARSQITEKTRMVEETYKEKIGVILELSVEEAEAVATILGHRTGGDNDLIMSVYSALKAELSMYSSRVIAFNDKIDGFLRVRA